ncbi:hypothetical protein ACJJTC_011525 [Scirpophaga incertulas]
MAGRINELGKCYITSSLYVRTNDKKSLFVTETFNYENMSYEEFVICATPYDSERSRAMKTHRLVLVAGDGEHVPIFRSRVHYVLQDGSVAFSGDRHPASQIGQTTYNGQSMNVVKVQSGFFAPKAFSRLGALLRKKFNTSPSSADPVALGWSLLADGSSATEAKLIQLYPDIGEVQASDPDYKLSLSATLRTGLYLLFEDSKLTEYSLYEGIKQGKDVVCPITGIRFCCRAKHSSNAA